MYRTLRFQLIAIAVFALAAVLTTSQWVDTRLSEHALEQDLRDRALLVLRTVDSLWQATDPQVLPQLLEAIVQGDREVEAIDVFRLSGAETEMEVTTRHEGQAVRELIGDDQATAVMHGTVVTTVLPATEGANRWRMLLPLRRDGRIIGAAQVELWPADLVRLKHRLRINHGLVLASSIGTMSLAFALLLQRRVARPVAALVRGMRQAEAGDLAARVAPAAGEEFSFLAERFNRMLARIEDLTIGLEARVAEATKDLAAKNIELQRANEQLWQAQLEIGRSERLAALGQMAATIAHELGTPLNSILGYVQLVQRDALAPSTAEKLAIVESQVQRMVDTIRSVLGRTRDAPSRRVPVRVASLVEEAMAIVSARLRGRQLTARTAVPPDLPSLPGDPIELRQVLLNLLTNAIDATDPGGTVEVAAAVVSGDGGGRRGPSLELMVKDSGHGMSSDELRRAFEPFYTTKAAGRGTGLGLVIVDHIVRAHGGQLVVDSVPGRGTRMQVRLPLES